MVDTYLKYIKYERRYSEHTITSYTTDLHQFRNFLIQNFEGLNILEANHSEVRAWVVALVEKNLDSNSINRKIASLKSFFKFLMKREEIKKDPTWKIKALKSAKRLPQFVRENEMLVILDNIDFDDDFIGSRDKLIMEVLYGTGVRLSELLNLKCNDINLNNLTIKVLGKRNKERIIPISEPLREVISDYNKVKAKSIDSKKYLLVTKGGKKCYPMVIYRTVKKYLNALAKVEKNSPHVLRHTFATHLLNKGADLNAVKDLLGHSSLAATQIYTHNSMEKLKAVFDNAHPKA
jgi:integrase/recombinase XerC